ncbi:MAG TPA: MOSC and FAD-binding oxidoreductase domain-containing protein [Acidimicrobiales bacterium]
MDREPILLSVNVGMPKDVDWNGRTVFTGAWKYPVNGPRIVRKNNLDGDGQGDLQGHGGEMRAVLVYQLASYWHWQEYFDRDDLAFGNFGENLTVDGLSDEQVCIGDHYRIGTAEFEVTQPRVTCYRVGMRLGQPELPALLVSHHRPGFYMRVITQGLITAGDKIVNVKEGPGALSVADTDALLYLPNKNKRKLRAAVQISALSPGWQQSFHQLLSNSDACGQPAPSSPDVLWRGFRTLRVTEVVHETHNVTSISLCAEDGSPLPIAHAGQYLTLRLAGVGQQAPVRNYSLSGPVDAGVYRISVKAESGGAASPFLNESVHPGDSLEVAAPRGEFTLEEGNRPVLLVSAGIGVTPVLSMLYQLAGERSRRDVWWMHAARRPEEQALAAEAHRLLVSLPHARERIFYSTLRPEYIKSEAAVAGRLGRDALESLDVPADATAYICGPTAFMDDIREALVAIGLSSGDIHTELFGATSALNPGIVGSTERPPHQPAGSPGSGPLVTFARSNLSVNFGGAGRTLLELAEACDVKTRWSCRTGVCHYCVTPILAGDVSYSPDPLEPPRPQEILICCSEPKTDVVLDM